MEKSKSYKDVRFTPEVIREATQLLSSFYNDEQQRHTTRIRTVALSPTERWSYDTDEEFFADLRRDYYRASYAVLTLDFRINFTAERRNADISISAKSRHQIEAVFEIFEKAVEHCRLPAESQTPSPKPHVFIGHGQCSQWRDLKDHLHEKHGYDVEAYEIGARAGHAIRDIVEEMLDRSSFAILLMTGEDRDEDGRMRARQNVIHELGLFQGRLGFARGIVLLEEGTKEFSNIHGIQQIRYSRGNIKETFGEVVATLRREFGI